MLLIKFQQRQTSLEISKTEPHLNTESNDLSLLPKLWGFSNQCRGTAGVRGFKRKRRKKYEHMQGNLKMRQEHSERWMHQNGRR